MMVPESTFTPNPTNRNHGPAVPWPFFGIVAAYAVLSFAMIGGWLFYDHRPDA